MSPARRAYMLIFRDTTPEVYAEMSQEQTREQLDRWNGWIDDLTDAGLMMDGRPLEDGGVVVSAAGAQAMDGPFAEAKELVGGFFIVQVEGEQEATAIARQCPLLEYGMTVEVRPVSPVCHLARKLGMADHAGPRPRRLSRGPTPAPGTPARSRSTRGGAPAPAAELPCRRSA